MDNAATEPDQIVDMMRLGEPIASAFPTTTVDLHCRRWTRLCTDFVILRAGNGRTVIIRGAHPDLIVKLRKERADRNAVAHVDQPF